MGNNRRLLKKLPYGYRWNEASEMMHICIYICIHIYIYICQLPLRCDSVMSNCTCEYRKAAAPIPFRYLSKRRKAEKMASRGPNGGIRLPAGQEIKEEERGN